MIFFFRCLLHCLHMQLIVLCFFLIEQMFCCSYFRPSPPLAAPTTSTQFKMCLLQKFRNAIERSLDSRQSTCISVYVLHIVRSKPCSPCISVYINCPTNIRQNGKLRVTGVDTCMYSMRPTLRIVPELGVMRVVCCVNIQ